jgi:hypothetical protein
MWVFKAVENFFPFSSKQLLENDGLFLLSLKLLLEINERLLNWFIAHAIGQSVPLPTGIERTLTRCDTHTPKSSATPRMAECAGA